MRKMIRVTKSQVSRMGYLLMLETSRKMWLLLRNLKFPARQKLLCRSWPASL